MTFFCLPPTKSDETYHRKDSHGFNQFFFIKCNMLPDSVFYSSSTDNPEIATQNPINSRSCLACSFGEELQESLARETETGSESADVPHFLAETPNTSTNFSLIATEWYDRPRLFILLWSCAEFPVFLYYRRGMHLPRAPSKAFFIPTTLLCLLSFC